MGHDEGYGDQNGRTFGQVGRVDGWQKSVANGGGEGVEEGGLGLSGLGSGYAGDEERD